MKNIKSYIDIQMKFLRSSLENKKYINSIQHTIDWIKDQNNKINVEINKIDFKEFDNWNLDKESIRHKSKNFFSIDGINVKTNYGKVTEWDQPIINQPEVGYLGIIVKEFNGILHFLMQAKIEPGNINHVQISPTLQATRSNYEQVHQGKKPLYLEYFQNVKPNQILLDQLQSEQGARFLKKRNRNIIIIVNEEIKVHENFIWLTLSQIKKMMSYDNLVNMDTRTVISGIRFGNLNKIDNNDKIAKSGNQFLRSSIDNQAYHNNLEDIINFLTKHKSMYDLEINKININELKNWKINESEIYHEEKKYFKVIAVDVKIENREVVSWKQPMIEPCQKGLCAFICKKINGNIHFLVQAKLECGNHDIIEFAPTVQCLTGGYHNSDILYLDYLLNIDSNKIIFDTLQSEEGGRFFREVNRNMIVVDNDFTLCIPENYIWMTLNQLNIFTMFNNYLNIQARSLIAAIQYK